MKDLLESLRGAKFVGVAELAAAAGRLLAAGGWAQARGTVSEVPDERTIRYYLTEGLVSPAEEKQGTASVFSYRHLLQILVVKKLQAEHLPIRKIRDLVDSRSERELERLLGASGGGAEKNEALSYLEKLLTNATPRPAPPPSGQTAAAAASVIRPAQAAAMPQAPASSGGGGTWSRVELEPGLEVHVHDQYQPPTDTKGLRRLSQLLLHVLESHGRRPRKRGS